MNVNDTLGLGLLIVLLAVVVLAFALWFALSIRRALAYLRPSIRGKRDLALVVGLVLVACALIVFACIPLGMTR